MFGAAAWDSDRGGCRRLHQSRSVLAGSLDVVAVAGALANAAGAPADRPCARSTEEFQMILRQNRVMSVLAATAATLAVGASPALAGENDDDGDDDDEATQVAPTQSTGSDSGAGTSVPQGGVATGAGGMAEQGADATLVGLASGALVLMATGGGLVAAARRGES
jgi:hypothetical protein